MDNGINMQHYLFVCVGYDSVEFAEVGPRMAMCLFELWAGTLDNKETWSGT